MTTTDNPAGTYTDVRQYLDELDRRGLLIRVDRETNKDTEIMPLVRWQFRGLSQDQRKGWLFSNVTDSRGRHFDGSEAVSILGASPTVYAAKAAFEKAGVAPRDIDVIQLQDTDAGAEVIHMAEAGFCADGEQEKLLADGATEIGGAMPVNTDGGLIANGEPTMGQDPALVILPSAALLITVMSLNLLADAIRRRLAFDR